MSVAEFLLGFVNHKLCRVIPQILSLHFIVFHVYHHFSLNLRSFDSSLDVTHEALLIDDPTSWGEELLV